MAETSPLPLAAVGTERLPVHTVFDHDDSSEAGLPIANGDIIYRDAGAWLNGPPSAAPGVNYWDRTGTDLSPKTAGDNVVTGAGTISLGAANPVVLEQTGADELTVTADDVAIFSNDVTINNDLVVTNDLQADSVGVGVGAPGSAGFLEVANLLEIPATADATTGVLTQNGTVFYQTYGDHNIFIGPDSGNYTLTGSANTALGGYGGAQAALRSLTSGSHNFGLGQGAGTALTSGNYNVFIGSNAGRLMSTSSNCVGIGYGAFFSATGSSNTAIGHESLYKVSAANVVGIGPWAGFNNTSGADNTYLGAGAGYYQQTGKENVMVGTTAGMGSALHSVTGCVYIGNDVAKTWNATKGNNQLAIHNADSLFPLIGGEFGSHVNIHGELRLGGAAAAPDVVLSRTAADELTVTADDAVIVSNDLDVTNSLGVGVAATGNAGEAKINDRLIVGSSSRDAAIAINSTRSDASFCFGFTIEGTYESTGSHAYGMWMNPTLSPGNGRTAVGFEAGCTVTAPVGETITNAYAGYLARLTKSGAGTLTSVYGLYLQAQNAGTTNWGLYDTNAKSYIETALHMGADVILARSAADELTVTADDVAIFSNDVEVTNALFVLGMKTGANQAGAGAAANELWATNGHATLPDNVVMIGV